jgi:hypothetical protein
MGRGLRHALLRFAAGAWFLVALSYIPWVWSISGMAYHRADFTVDRWTLATPFLTVLVVPIGALAIWLTRDTLGAILIAVVAANEFLWQVVGCRMIVVREPMPFSVFLSLLSVLSLVVVGAIGFSYLTTASNADSGPRA